MVSVVLRLLELWLSGGLKVILLWELIALHYKRIIAYLIVIVVVHELWIGVQLVLVVFVIFLKLAIFT
jgi:hypothetical protein